MRVAAKLAALAPKLNFQQCVESHMRCASAANSAPHRSAPLQRHGFLRGFAQPSKPAFLLLPQSLKRSPTFVGSISLGSGFSSLSLSVSLRSEANLNHQLLKLGVTLLPTEPLCWCQASFRNHGSHVQTVLTSKCRHAQNGGRTYTPRLCQFGQHQLIGQLAREMQIASGIGGNSRCSGASLSHPQLEAQNRFL